MTNYFKYRYNLVRSCLSLYLFIFILFASLCVCTTAYGFRFDLFNDFIQLETYESNKSYYPGEKWRELIRPETAGWSTQKLSAAREYAESIHSDALVVVYNGLIVLAHGNYKERYKIHSVRKSLMNVMYGIYVTRAKIDINKTLTELEIDDIPPLTSQERQATVRNLLMSKSGVYHPAAYETRGMIEKRPLRESHKPGTFWYYNNWDFNTLATIFNNQTGQDFFKAFDKDVAGPLQMEQFRLQDTYYKYEKEKSIHPAYLFRMSALDLARIGLLYLREGTWESKQLISPVWVDESTSPLHLWSKDNRKKGYGYLWKAIEDGYYASGVGGQRIIVAPEYKLVVVHSTNTTGKKRISSKKIWNLYKKIKASYTGI